MRTPGQNLQFTTKGTEATETRTVGMALQFTAEGTEVTERREVAGPSDPQRKPALWPPFPLRWIMGLPGWTRRSRRTVGSSGGRPYPRISRILNISR